MALDDALDSYYNDDSAFAFGMELFIDLPPCLSPCPALLTLGAELFGNRFKLRFISHNKATGGGVSNTLEMRIVCIKRADRQTAWFKAKPLVIAGFTQDKQGLAFDRLLAQGKSKQFRAHPLPLKFWRHGHRRQVQPADVVAMKSIGKCYVGDGFAGMNANPFVDGSAVRVEFLHQSDFVFTAGKGALQKRVDLGTALDCQFLYFHTIASERPRFLDMVAYSSNMED
jgi:hypothetical protein